MKSQSFRKKTFRKKIYNNSIKQKHALKNNKLLYNVQNQKKLGNSVRKYKISKTYRRQSKQQQEEVINEVDNPINHLNQNEKQELKFLKFKLRKLESKQAKQLKNIRLTFNNFMINGNNTQVQLKISGVQEKISQIEEIAKRKYQKSCTSLFNKYAQNGNLIKLVALFRKKNFQVDLNNCEAFIISIIKGDYEIVKFFLENGINVKIKVHFDAFFQAFEKGHIDIVNLFQEKDINFNEKLCRDKFLEACKHGNSEHLQFFFEIIKDISNQLKLKGFILSAKFNHDEITKMFLANGANVKTNDFVILLDYIQNKNFQMVKYLIDKEKVPFSHYNLNYALQYGNENIKQYLWNEWNSQKDKFVLKELMYQLYIDKNYETLKFLVKKGIYLCPYNDAQKLHLLFQQNDVSMVQVYIKLSSQQNEQFQQKNDLSTLWKQDFYQFIIQSFSYQDIKNNFLLKVLEIFLCHCSFSQNDMEYMRGFFEETPILKDDQSHDLKKLLYPSGRYTCNFCQFIITSKNPMTQAYGCILCNLKQNCCEKCYKQIKQKQKIMNQLRKIVEVCSKFQNWNNHLAIMKKHGVLFEKDNSGLFYYSKNTIQDIFDFLF